MSNQRPGNRARAIPVDGTGSRRVGETDSWSDRTEVHPGSGGPDDRAPVPEEPLPIARLGRYRLERLIGQGGMAEVYLARADGPAGFEKQVVVKRIKPVHLANKRFVEMFLREARVLSTLDHPNVVKIFELDQEGSEYFVAMEYLEGITLRDLADRNWLAGRPLPIEHLVRAVADAALGLDHAHNAVDRAGRPAHIVHRDVSPDNLFLTGFGATKVLDFGIAKREGIDVLTQAGEIKGKIPYMSPEQLTGQPLDGRTDLWSLGVCLYWLLTGRRPFDAASEMMTMRNIVEKEPPPLRQLNPQVPESLEAVVLSTLRKEKSERIASGAALHDALMLLLVGLPKPPLSVQQLVEQSLPLAQPEVEVHPSLAAVTTVPWPEREAVPSPTAPTRLSLKTAEIEEAARQRSAALEAPPADPPTAGEASAAPDLPPTLKLPQDEVREALAEARARQSAPAPVGAVLAPPREVSRSRPPSLAPAAPKRKPDRGAGILVVGILALLLTLGALAGSLWWLGMLPLGAGSGGKIALKGPDHIAWLLPPSTLLCHGTCEAAVPDDGLAILAHDPVRGVRTRLPILGGEVDYAAAPRGKLAVLAPPGADVYLGSEHLGASPVEPVDVVAGAYRVRVIFEGRERSATVEVREGAPTRVSVDPRAP